jgi:hypothetical protein
VNRSMGLLETLSHVPGVRKVASIGTDLLSSAIYLAALTRHQATQQSGTYTRASLLAA